LDTVSKGKIGEDLATAHLVSLGYRLLERNARTKRGEIDIVARSPDKVLCFVEVKAALTPQAGHPASWITPHKVKRLQRAAQAWLALHREPEAQEMRFDAIAILMYGTPPVITHLPGAFLPDGSGYF
jgi:putative endonuclease